MSRLAFKKVIADNPSGTQLDINKSTAVRVFVAGSTLLATIYTTKTGGTLKSNPFNATDGVAEFYAEPGLYDIECRIGDTVVAEFKNYALYDPAAINLQTSLPLQFETVAAMKSGTAMNYPEAIDFSQFEGRQVKTVYNNLTSRAGGADYVIWSLAAYRTAIGNPSWVPDGDVGHRGVNHLTSSGLHVAIYQGLSIDLEGAGAIGDGLTNDTAAIQRALDHGPLYIRVSHRAFKCDTVYVSRSGTIIEGAASPAVDMTNNSLIGGSIIIGTIAASGADNLTIESIGIDSSAPSLTEGISVASSRGVKINCVTIIADDNNNHCCLVEACSDVNINNVTTFGGKQALAVKAIDFFIQNVTSYDTVTYGFTLRYSPGAPCHDGFVKNVICKTNLKTKSGGAILMNDQSGAALRDITIDGLLVDDCNNGFYITNTGNTTKATGIKLGNISIKNIVGYGFQTFGNVDNISVNGIDFQDCGGTYYTNQATDTTRLTISKHTQKNAGIGLLSGAGHKLYSWEKSGGGGFFLQNTSSQIEFYDMDATVIAVSNITDASGTGTSARRCSNPLDATITQNGSLYGMRLRRDSVVKIANTYNTNDEVTIFTMPNNDDCIVELLINTLTTAGRHCAKYLICGETVTKLGGDSNQNAVFTVVLSGAQVRLRYLYTAGEVYATCIYTQYAQDV